MAGSSVYAFPSDDFDACSALQFIQQHVPGMNVKGESPQAEQMREQSRERKRYLP